MNSLGMFGWPQRFSSSVLIFFLWMINGDVLSQALPPNTTLEGMMLGKIIDSATSQPVEYAQVRLLNSADSLVVTGIYSDEKGAFFLDKIPLGTYIVKITSMGFRTYFVDDLNFSSATAKIELGTIGLISDQSGNLDAVVITGEKELLKTGIDKKVFNVSEDLSSRGGSANDVLNKLPSVAIDQDGNITMRGDGNITILIDGRPSSFSGGNGKSLLDALPASSIDRIEIVTNPSAKYSPDGTSGIINIVLKKNKMRGMNGLMSSTAATGNLVNESASFSYRNSKFNLFSNYTFRYSEGYRNNFGSLKLIFNDDSTSTLLQNRIGTDLNAGHMLRLGSDFYLNAQQVLGVLITGSQGIRNRTGHLSNQLFNDTKELVSNWDRISEDPTDQKNLDLNLNYKLDFKEEKGNFSADLTQSLGKENASGLYHEKYYDLEGFEKKQQIQWQQLSNLEKNNISTLQIDFTRFFSKTKARFESGAKSIISDLAVSTNSQSLDTLTQTYFEDTLSNFVYQYNEQVYGVYGIFGQEIGKLKYQGGVRAEQAFQTPYLKSTNEKYANAYFKVYPSAHVKFCPTENVEWSISYSRRINRASASNMNPFTSYADPFNLRRGNPALLPEFIHSFDLGYFIEKEIVTMTTSLYYRQTSDVIQRAKFYYDNNTSAVTFINIDQSQSVGFEFVLVLKPVKGFKNTISINGSAIRYIDNSTDSDFNNSGLTGSAKYIGTVDFWKKTATIQLNANYIAPRVTAQGVVQRRGGIDVSAEKKMYGGKWVVGMRVTDIFNRQGFSFEIEQPSIVQTSDFKWLTRRFYLTISYKFGKLEVFNKRPVTDAPSMDF
jgi:outer membrane receptor protein involved in Fe transport